MTVSSAAEVQGVGQGVAILSSVRCLNVRSEEYVGRHGCEEQNLNDDSVVGMGVVSATLSNVSRKLPIHGEVVEKDTCDNLLRVAPRKLCSHSWPWG